MATFEQQLEEFEISNQASQARLRPQLSRSNLVPAQGFDLQRLVFPPLKELNEDFICQQCKKLLNLPLECEQCGTLTCQACCIRTDDFNFNCASCQKEKKDSKMSSVNKIVKKIYDKYEVTCNGCKLSFSVKDIEEHEAFCQSGKCENELCNNQIRVNQRENITFTLNGIEKVACSKKCKKVAKFSFLLKRRNDETEILKAFEKMLKKKMQKAQSGIKQSVEIRNQPGLRTCQTGRLDREKPLTGLSCDVKRENESFFIGEHQLEGMDEFLWDKENSSKDIQYSSDFRHAFLFESNYYFRTIISNRPFMSGVHYWEIIADGRTEHELKVGVTCQQKFNVNSSFSDYEFGFAYYGLGQLRHGSNALGIPYGKPFKKKGCLGVCLNMNSGTLSFALDGEYMGVAYEDPYLKTGPIWAAVSLLHIAGCTLVSGLEKPQYFIH